MQNILQKNTCFAACFSANKSSRKSFDMLKRRSVINFWIISCFCVATGFVGCTTIPPKEVHSAAGISRSIILDSTPRDQAPRRVSVGGGISRGAGNQDIGKQDDSTNLEASVELRIVERFAIGLQTYLSIPDQKLDVSSNLGATLYGRWRFLDIGKWAFSIAPRIGYGKNSAEADGRLCGIFGCVSNGVVSRSEAEIVDPGLGFIVSYYLNDRNVFSLIPTLYFAYENGAYSVANVERFSGSERGLEYSAMLTYGYIFGVGKRDAMIQLGAGVNMHQGFGPFASTHHIAPLVQLGIQFSLGSELGR